MAKINAARCRKFNHVTSFTTQQDIGMGTSEPTEAIVKVASEITSYLDKHPQASDTLEGVTTWWLMKQRYESSREIVEAALNYLMDIDVVKSFESNEKQIYYSKKDSTR